MKIRTLLIAAYVVFSTISLLTLAAAATSAGQTDHGTREKQAEVYDFGSGGPR